MNDEYNDEKGHAFYESAHDNIMDHVSINNKDGNEDNVGETTFITSRLTTSRMTVTKVEIKATPRMTTAFIMLTTAEKCKKEDTMLTVVRGRQLAKRQATRKTER